jgi:hypothetical protein
VPVANPHRLPEPGKVGAGGEWALTALPAGSYTWTLRAVDSAYNGGSVAQGSFHLGVTVAVETSSVLPRAYAFEPSYPNPFRASTTFRFALPERASVKLLVYDLGGRLVARLVDETRDAGIHEIPWATEGLASGAYFVRLSAGAFHETRRVVLLR